MVMLLRKKKLHIQKTIPSPRRSAVNLAMADKNQKNSGTCSPAAGV